MTSNSAAVRAKLEARKAGLEGKAVVALTQASQFLEGKMAEKISLGQLDPALKPETIARKGSSKPLFDEGYLLQQIDHKVDGLTAEVGVFDGEEKRAFIAMVHEWGSPARNIPERSFMRSTMEENRKGVRKIFEKGMKSTTPRVNYP